jgi:hypothetical protein
MSRYDTVIQPDKFWLIVSPKGQDECWDWPKGVNTTGYGLYSIRSPNWLYEKTGRTSTQLLSHRVAYYLTHGEFNRDDNVNHLCHKCDNRRCCNPNHMFVGSMYDNIQDMISKGRGFWQKHKT